MTAIGSAPSRLHGKVVLVQILASALPGFRDLRAPLTAGYLWVFFLWILVKPDLNNPPTNAVAGAVYDLAKEVGRSGSRSQWASPHT